MKEKKKFKINHHLIIIPVIILIVVVCVVRILQWNARTIAVDLSDIKEGDYDMECLDFYVYPEEGQSNDMNNVLVIGNVLMNNYGEEHSVLNILKESFPETNFIDVTVEKSILTSKATTPSYGLDSFSLYHLTNAICTGNYHYQDATYPTEGFDSEERYATVMTTLHGLDLNDIDSVIILYSLQDYFSVVPTIFADEYNVYGYHGALLSSIQLLQETAPHLRIFLASPCPVYMEDSNGNIQLGTLTDFGMGNASSYISHQYAVATQCCISYIDNYFYVIDENNISEYTDGFFPNDLGIDVIAEHIVHFLKNKGN